MAGAARGRRWIDELDDEELAFVRRLVLASGSLKEVAAQYGVSYPTVRRRLDRLIAVIEALDRTAGASRLERTVRSMLASGRIDAEAARRILDAAAGDREEEP